MAWVNLRLCNALTGTPLACWVVPLAGDGDVRPAYWSRLERYCQLVEAGRCRS